MWIDLSRRIASWTGTVGCALLIGLWPVVDVQAQNVDPKLLEEASRRSGQSPSELLKQLDEATDSAAGMPDTTQAPGRTTIETVNDSRLRSGRAQADRDYNVVLPLSHATDEEAGATDPDTEEPRSGSAKWFGRDFFQLDRGLFVPPSFGPVPEDYVLGVGDQIAIDVWGEAEFRLTRVVDRDGTVVLPEAGRITCAGRTLAEVDQTVRSRLAQHHASMGKSADDPAAKTWVRVTLGQLRPIRVFVVGAAESPGSYELNSVSTVLSAVYAAGGPSPTGSLRHVRLVRRGQVAVELDLYDYLLGGDRTGDVQLREGDTVYIPVRDFGVSVQGAVRRPMHYEMLPGETISHLVEYAGGLTADAAADRVHITRILGPAERREGEPDRIRIDIPFQANSDDPLAGRSGLLRDGDIVRVDRIDTTVGAWVRIKGRVKRPGVYQMRPGLTISGLIDEAGGLWPDALVEWSTIDRTSPALEYSSLSVPLERILDGELDPTPLQARDIVHVYSRGVTYERPTVYIGGEVHRPLTLDFRQGMTLRDLVLRAGGLKQGANELHAEIARLRVDVLANLDRQSHPPQAVDVIRVELGPEFLDKSGSVSLEPWDRVAIRRLPWWQTQQTVTIAGEVFYPGEFSLERRDETLSSIMARAGGLKPTAYPAGARVVRSQDNVGNIAIDLRRAMAEPGSQYDIILEPGDRIVIPNRMFTVKVIGEVGFPTSLVHEQGRDIDYYVRRAGGYLENADEGRTRVVHPNGMSLPNEGSSEVIAGSTIIVPLKPPPEGPTKLETAREITGILAGVATIWLVIDATTR